MRDDRGSDGRFVKGHKPPVTAGRPRGALHKLSRPVAEQVVEVLADIAAVIKRADHISAFHEATQLAGFKIREARTFFGAPPGNLRTPRLVALSTADAEQLFLDRFHRLAV